MNRVPLALLLSAISAVFALSHPIGAENPDGQGTCYDWDDDPLPRVLSCQAGTEVECAQGKRPILNKDNTQESFTAVPKRRQFLSLEPSRSPPARKQ